MTIPITVYKLTKITLIPDQFQSSSYPFLHTFARALLLSCAVALGVR